MLLNIPLTMEKKDTPLGWENIQEQDIKVILDQVYIITGS